MLRWIHSGGAFEALCIAFGASLTIAVCLCLGSLCFSKNLKSWPERFVCGAALLQLAVFALALGHFIYSLVLLLFSVLVFYLYLRSKPKLTINLHICHYTLFLSFTLYFLLYFLNAMAPEASPDGAAYHLGFVAEYLRRHGFHPITWNIYASFPEAIEMLFLFAFAFGKHSAAALVHFAFLVALAWQMIVYSRRSGFPCLGACAALLVFASPVVGKTAASAYNDAALACVAFTLFNVLQLWDETRNPSLLLPIGLLAGFAYAIKYTGGVAILYAIAFVWWKSRRSREALPVAVAAAVMVVPWMAKNWLWVRNPVSPFFNSWFPNPFVTTWFEEDYRKYLQLYELHSRWQIPLAVTVRGELAGVLGPVFLLAPLALLALRRREGRQLLLAAAVFGSTYFSNIGARFLIPPLPFVALAMMLAISNQTLAMAVALLHAVLCLPFVVTRYALPGAWTLHDMPVWHALRFRPESEYLKAHLPQYGIDLLLDRATPPGATVLTYQAIPEAYTSRRVLVEYESAANHAAAVTLWTGFLPGWNPSWRASFSFARQQLLGFRMVQTTGGASQWRIHELRAFDGASEIPRANWRATANPSPWGISAALDGNPVTSWISGDPLRAGAYVEAQFTAPVELDAVLLETSPNQPELRLQLYGEASPGVWKRLGSEPDIFRASAPDLRGAAIEELKRQGIGYVLLFENDEVTKAVQEAGAGVGMAAIGKSSGATLYRLP